MDIEKQETDICFPNWNPQKVTRSKMQLPDYKTRLRAIRNSSSGFGARKDVRDIIFSDYDNKCAICDTTDNLQIDHVISIYQAANYKIPLSELNQRQNLQILCLHCNMKKKP